jgi:crotonobetainyl-CoA:carnitine CoA-transferase CaiB-like acyl-CoA transferase
MTESVAGSAELGPRAPYRAYASTISNFIGLTALTGYAHGTHADYITAEHGALGVLAALRQAGRTGRGVKLDVAEIEGFGELEDLDDWSVLCAFLDRTG